MMRNPIDEALGLPPIICDEPQNTDIQIQTERSEITISDTIVHDENLKDIERARQNVEQIVELGREALDEMISLAKQSESPRAFEVASTLMKTLLDANREFVEMSTRKKYAKEELLNPKKDEPATSVTNNNLILTTTDLLKMIKGEDV